VRECRGVAIPLCKKKPMIFDKKEKIKKGVLAMFTFLLLIFLNNVLLSAPPHYGLETLSSAFIQKYNLPNKKIGLVTNQTGVDHAGTPSVQVLLKKGVCITRIFAPEHGYTGRIPAGKSVEDSIEPVSKIPIVSLYAHEKGLVGKTINADKFSDLDAIIFDMQDSGMRHYTYISTLLRVLEACAAYHKLCIVLDRPNFLGGRMEGLLVEPELISFISIAPIPLRHGMTIGELAHYFNSYVLREKAELIVVPMAGYNRAYSGTFLKKPLSPNLATVQACLGYSFLGLLGEISPFNVGIGTKHAFRVIMLPTTVKVAPSVWPQLQQLLNKYGIASIRHTTIDERTKKKVTGVLLQFGDIGRTKTFSLFLDIVSLFIKHGVKLTCAPTFDKAVGMLSLRTAIEKGESLAPFKKQAHDASAKFFHRVKHLFLYQPHPQVD
jgi:uncharacterized protein YbbC (DUF1343 family)